ncbi:MAG: catalase, partial [Trebonia sp.]
RPGRGNQGTFVKWHWRPKLGTHSLVWDETQKVAGKDPDFNRRDLWEAIDNGDFPEWELCVQLVEQEREHDFDFDLLDATKLIPEEEVPLRPIGRMVLDRNPDNFFAETEQVAFHTANAVRGVDFTNDPLLQARNFSYLDTQLIRLGGPNFAQLPVNRPVAPVHHHQRDGYGQHRIDQTTVSYHPNSLGGGCPGVTAFDEGGYRHYQERVDGAKIRRRSPSFDDHYSQPALFWNSMSDWERTHIVAAFAFELGHVDHRHVRERVVAHLARIDGELASGVAELLGLQAPDEQAASSHGKSSPALSQADQPRSVATLKVAVLIADGVDGGSLQSALRPLHEQGAICELLAPHNGAITTADGGEIESDRSIVTMSSVLYDAVLVAGGGESVETLLGHGEAVHYVAEAYRHAKALGALGAGVDLLRHAPLPDGVVPGNGNGLVSDAGVVTAGSSNGNNGELEAFGRAFAEAVAARRHFERDLAAVPASDASAASRRAHKDRTRVLQAAGVEHRDARADDLTGGFSLVDPVRVAAVDDRQHARRRARPRLQPVQVPAMVARERGHPVCVATCGRDSAGGGAELAGVAQRRLGRQRPAARERQRRQRQSRQRQSRG